MIGVKDGKVTWIDNDSGHYLPGTHHLRKLVQYLYRYQVFTPDATVYDMAEKQSISVRDFVKPAIPSRARRPPKIPSRANRPHRIHM